MTSVLLVLDPDSSLSLQGQIRIGLIEAIMNGQLPPGVRLPSTRQLARQLGVSRNTAIAAVQELISEGYLISRERSGCYVNEAVLKRGLDAPEEQVHKEAHHWRLLPFQVKAESLPALPLNWRQYPFPFVSGQVDKDLFPLGEWRECERITQSPREVGEWITDPGVLDDPQLVEQIRTKLLPPRGIHAAPDEILITNGAEAALSLVNQLLVNNLSTVGVERPGSRQVATLFESSQAELRFLAVDDEGLVVDDQVKDCRLVYVTPSHQYPTAVTMSMARRKALLATAEAHNVVILEDDYCHEANFVKPNSPALKALDQSGRVIYMSSLSDALAPGLRIGYMVAHRELIAAARQLRRITSSYPARNNQRTCAMFLSLGHYDTLVRKLDQVHKERWLELRQAVNYHFPQPDFTINHVEGGTAVWIQAPGQLDVDLLVKRAGERGVLLDAPQNFLLPDKMAHCFRLSVGCIDVDKIRPGLEVLSNVIHEMFSGYLETLDDIKGRVLTEAEIHEVMPGAALIGSTAYGDPYTVRIHAEGAIDIQYDNSTRDTDTGRWWVSGGQWWRQFSKSTYGEARGFYVVLEKELVKWFDSDGHLVDCEVFVRDFSDAPQLD